MADIYSGWEKSLISAGFMLTAGSKSNCAVLMQSHIASRTNKTNGLGCIEHNWWSLCSKLHHFIWQSHNASEKYGCRSGATQAASERWHWGLCFPFIILRLGTMRETKHFLLSKQVFEINSAKTSNFPWQANGTKWMISFYPRIIRHPNCSLTPPIPTTQPIPPKEKMEKQDVSGIVWDQTVSGCQCETNESFQILFMLMWSGGLMIQLMEELSEEDPGFYLKYKLKPRSDPCMSLWFSSCGNQNSISCTGQPGDG